LKKLEKYGIALKSLRKEREPKFMKIDLMIFEIYSKSFELL